MRFEPDLAPQTTRAENSETKTDKGERENAPEKRKIRPNITRYGKKDPNRIQSQRDRKSGIFSVKTRYFRYNLLYFSSENHQPNFHPHYQ